MGVSENFGYLVWGSFIRILLFRVPNQGPPFSETPFVARHLIPAATAEPKQLPAAQIHANRAKTATVVLAKSSFIHSFIHSLIHFIYTSIYI